MPAFWRSIQKKHVQREIDTYRHLPPHPRLVPLLDSDDEASLTIEYMPNGSVATYLKRHAATTTALRTQWIRQAAEGVALLHANDVIHADLKPTNLLLDGHLDLRVADFGGCSLLGQQPYTLETGAFYLPAKWRDTDKLGCSVETDLFALGSCIFYIATGKVPHDGLSDEDTETKFAGNEFPSVEGVLFAQVIRGCWQGTFTSAEAVLGALGV